MPSDLGLLVFILVLLLVVWFIAIAFGKASVRAEVRAERDALLEALGRAERELDEARAAVAAGAKLLNRGESP